MDFTEQLLTLIAKAPLGSFTASFVIPVLLRAPGIFLLLNIEVSEKTKSHIYVVYEAQGYYEYYKVK